MTQHGDVRAELMVACRHDVPDIVELVSRRLPEMTYMRDTDGWRKRHRFGAGLHSRDNYLVIVRVNGDGPLVGLAWVDAAMAYDHDIAEPWWCINAVAVAEEFAGQGLGRQLVSTIRTQAEQIGITSLYGVCYPESAGFWENMGFEVGALDAGLRASEPITMFDGSTNTLNVSGEPGHHFFTSPGSLADGVPYLVVP